MSNLPFQVEKYRQILLLDTSDELYEVAQKLVVDSPDIVKMWKSIERAEKQRGYSTDADYWWVKCFLDSAKKSSRLPDFHYIPANERRELQLSITKLTKQLTILLEKNQLAGHLVHCDGSIFNGFYIYEDFSESNQARINDSGTHKLKITDLMKKVEERANEIIETEPLQGKTGTNVAAIRFVRLVLFD